LQVKDDGMGIGPELLPSVFDQVAVLDIGLPVMDGYELATRMREQLGASCRLIALTG
jgi:CheY-like chemotaxis protein